MKLAPNQPRQHLQRLSIDESGPSTSRSAASEAPKALDRADLDLSHISTAPVRQRRPLRDRASTALVCAIAVAACAAPLAVMQRVAADWRHGVAIPGGGLASDPWQAAVALSAAAGTVLFCAIGASEVPVAAAIVGIGAGLFLD